MSYTVLARKYRPQTFAELVGQEPVARILSNAITSGRLAHAFLFSGARGVGKTTSARIVAKSLNCEKGPTPTPCNECAPCKEITSGMDLDVLEIDGASNNSVDDVRRLQETIPFRPARDRFKIVIVDEVHMLSTGAFNAFLKTLEEPPPHVKFIFATTEIHKIPVTIRSRCQCHEFRLLPQAVIAQRLTHIVSLERLRVEESAIAVVAREAAGSMRDALTLLDQVISYTEDTITAEDVARLLGIAGRTQVRHALEATLDHNASGVLDAVDALASQGVDLLHFARQLVDLVRDLVVLSVSKGSEARVDLVHEELEWATGLTGRFSSIELQRAFSALSKLVDEVGKSSMPRSMLEMGLVRLATRPPLVSSNELMARLEALEKRLGGPARGGNTESEPSRPKSGSAPAPSRTAAPPRATAPLPAQNAAPVVAPAPTPPSAPLSPDDVFDTWTRMVTALREQRPALAAVVEHGVPDVVTRERIVLSFPSGSFFGRQADTPDALRILSEVAGSILGGTPTVQISYKAPAHLTGKTVVQVESSRKEQQLAEVRQQALSHPRVLEAIQLFPEAAGRVEVKIDEAQLKGD